MRGLHQVKVITQLVPITNLQILYALLVLVLLSIEKSVLLNSITKFHGYEKCDVMRVYRQHTESKDKNSAVADMTIPCRRCSDLKGEEVWLPLLQQVVLPDDLFKMFCTIGCCCEVSELLICLQSL